ncbi:hypothetical protein RB195_002546 [Necator americanus]|uniref:DUF3719 domain-containing protein n=1 Tax=Necator americanus TaxID=51031 RepID=A0ABR1DJK0_NECAM
MEKHRCLASALDWESSILQWEMSRWSESIYSEPNTSRGSCRGFLSELDSCLYEGVPMEDAKLDAEAREWAARFLHLRVLGVKCGIPSSTSHGDIRHPNTNPVTNTWHENNGQLLSRTEVNRRKTMLPSKKSSKSAVPQRSTDEHLPKVLNPRTK